MTDLPPELADLAIARNKAGGCRIVLPDDRASILEDHDHPTNPWRLFVPTGWTEINCPEVVNLLGVPWSRNSEGQWSNGETNASPALAAALDLLRVKP